MTVAPERSWLERSRFELRGRPTPAVGGVDLLLTAERLAAEELAAVASSRPDLHDRATRTWRTVASDQWFEAFVISWPVGGSVDLHDHGDSAGAVVVAAGDLLETAVVPAADGTLITSTRALPTGSHVAFGPGYVHDIVNRGPGPALSVHVYSPVLRSMTFFEQRSGDDLVPVRTEEFNGPGFG